MPSNARELMLAKMKHEAATLKRNEEFSANVVRQGGPHAHAMAAAVDAGAHVTRVVDNKVVLTSDPKHYVGKILPPPEANTAGEEIPIKFEPPLAHEKDAKAAIAELVKQAPFRPNFWALCKAIDDGTAEKDVPAELEDMMHEECRFPTFGNPALAHMAPDKDILFCREPRSLSEAEVDYLRACQYAYLRLVWYLREVRDTPAPAATSGPLPPLPAGAQGASPMAPN